MTQLKPTPQSTSSGFTLIEITLVMAISALLLISVLAGQVVLQRRSRFDAAIDQTIQNIDYARNYALANVNFEGGGNATSALIVGSEVRFNNANLTKSPPQTLSELVPIYASPTAGGTPNPATYANLPPGLAASVCPTSDHPNDPGVCSESAFHLQDTLSIAQPGQPNTSTAEIDYINTGSGLEVCHDLGSSFATVVAACTESRSSPVDITLKNLDGLSATIEIDSTTGYAKRLN